MGFLDSPDLLDNLKLLKEQYPAIAGLLGSLEPSEKDKKQAMTNALLTAGAGILAANTGKGPPMSAIGQGLLSGIQGYQQNIGDQRKDAMQRVSTIGGLLGLGQSLQKAQLYQDLMGAGSQATPAQPQTAGNLEAMSSVGGGNETGGMAPSQPIGNAPPAAIRAPSAIQPLVNQLQQAGVPDFVIKANLANGPSDGFKGITDLWKEMTAPQNVRQGGGLYDRNGKQIVQAPVLPQGQYYIPGQSGQPGVAVSIPGAMQGMEGNARANAAGGAQGGLPYQTVTVPNADPNQPGVEMTAEQRLGIARMRGNQALQGMSGAEPPDDVKQAMSTLAKMGVQARWTPNGGLAVGDAAKAAPASAGLGMTPSLPALKAAEAQAVLPAEAQKQNQAYAQDQNQKVLANADGARSYLAMADAYRAANPSTGAFADQRAWLANVVESSGFNPDKFGLKSAKDIQELRGLQGGILSAMAHSLPGALSDKEGASLKSTFAVPTNQKEANDFMVAFGEARANQMLAQEKFNLQWAEEHKGDMSGARKAFLENGPSSRYIINDPAMAPYLQKSQQEQTMAPQGAPPIKGAQQAPDGNWYVKSGSRYYRVQP